MGLQKGAMIPVLTKFLVKVFQWLAITYKIKDKLNYKLTIDSSFSTLSYGHTHSKNANGRGTFCLFIYSCAKDLWFESLPCTTSLCHEISHIPFTNFDKALLTCDNFTETFG